MELEEAAIMFIENQTVYATFKTFKDRLFPVDISELTGLHVDVVENALERLENLGKVRGEYITSSKIYMKNVIQRPKEPLYDGTVLTLDELEKLSGYDWKTTAGIVSRLRTEHHLIKRVCHKATGVIGYALA